jgi:prepilin-type N-terminal cleavage/methylation domain-containing protein
MIAHRGFTLTEVLVSLLLFTSISLALLKQQVQIIQLLNQLSTRISILITTDSIKESAFKNILYD